MRRQTKCLYLVCTVASEIPLRRSLFINTSGFTCGTIGQAVYRILAYINRCLYVYVHKDPVNDLTDCFPSEVKQLNEYITASVSTIFLDIRCNEILPT